MVKVLYNGIDVFKGIAPTPFIAVNNEFINYGNRWGNVQQITLNGTITGNRCVNSYSGLLLAQSGLFKNFSVDFQDLNVEDPVGVSTDAYWPNVKINSIDFDQSVYNAAVNFKINATCYPAEWFSGTFGVTEPTATIKYSEQQDGTVNINRSISAKGFNSINVGSSALDNARIYVQSLTGIQNVIALAPKFISGVNINSNTIYARKISETVNRFESVYSIDIDYVVRKGANTSTILKYSVDADYDEEKGFYTASLKGSVDGAGGKTIDDLRSEFTGNFKPYDITLTSFRKMSNYNYLNPTPDSISFDENEVNNTIDFSYKYTSDPQDVKFNYSMDLSNEYTNDTSTVSFNGTLVARGPASTRMAKVEAAFAALNIVPICQQFYTQNFPSASLPLNPNAKSYNIKRDLIAKTISIQATFDNMQIPSDTKFKTFNYSVSVTPSIMQYHPIQYLAGNNAIFNLNYYTRAKISIQGNATTKTAGDLSENVRSMAMSVLNSLSYTYGGYVNSLLLEDKVEKNSYSDENGYQYSFNISKSFESPVFS
jgi:hypothetical protein